MFAVGLVVPMVAFSQGGPSLPCNPNKGGPTVGRPPCPTVTVTTPVTTTVTVTTTTTTPTTPAPPQLLPETGKFVVAARTSGVLYYRLAPNLPRVALTGTKKLPIASHLDTRTGAMNLVTTAAGGGVQSVSVFGSVFRAQQTTSPVKGAGDPRAGVAAASLTTVLRLVGPPIPSCVGTSARARLSSATAVIARRRPRKKKVRRLWSSETSGSYQTVGSQAAATVLGTTWLTEDTCAGTRVYVRQGTVVVHNLRTGRNVTLTAHHAYTALAPPAP